MTDKVVRMNRNINSRYDPEPETCFAVGVSIPGGGHDLWLDLVELQNYNRDPDGFVAAYFGLTVDQYREWIALDGKPLCSARTRKGILCANQVNSIQCGAKFWLREHRAKRCWMHTDDYENEDKRERSGNNHERWASFPK